MLPFCINSLARTFGNSKFQPTFGLEDVLMNTGGLPPEPPSELRLCVAPERHNTKNVNVRMTVKQNDPKTTNLDQVFLLIATGSSGPWWCS